MDLFTYLRQREENEQTSDSIYLQDVPYSSSSFDRSSIDSIPWAEDAIKQNQTDWERIELLLNGEIPLPDNEIDLKNEIQQWQLKYAHLKTRRSSEESTIPSKTFDSSIIDTDTVSNASLSSTEEYNNNNNNNNNRKESFESTITSQSNFNDINNLSETLEQNLHINVMPLAKRKQRKYSEQSDISAFSTATSTNTAATNLWKAKQNIYVQPTEEITTTSAKFVPAKRFYMPPIMNVLESKRRFRSLANNSFVQLTRIQQKYTNSATSTTKQPKRAWQLAATNHSGRFLNNRNAIILPAINTNDFSSRQQQQQLLNRQHQQQLPRNRIAIYNNSRDSVESQSLSSYSTTSSIVPIDKKNTLKMNYSKSNGRSISAANYQPAFKFNALYFPLSASKFKILEQ